MRFCPQHSGCAPPGIVFLLLFAIAAAWSAPFG
jgi:hypothetical protein